MATPDLGARSVWRPGAWLLILLPVAVLVAMVVLFLAKGEVLVGKSPIPPDALLKIEFERVVFRPGEIIATVRNTGPDAVTIAQVTVNEALWQYAVSPGTSLTRMQQGLVTIPYPWEAGDPVEVKLITSNGLVFTKKVDIAAETPRPSVKALGAFALLGIYVGVVPVYLGFLWFPFLRRVRERWFHFFLSLTAGLLIFLGVDALKEALEAAGKVPGAFKGVGIILIGVSVGLLGLMAVGERTMGRARAGAPGGERLALAYLIAAGIGLHNLGEGLAIGAAYALGNIALGTFLIVGFTIHNTTEGLGVVAPVARDGVRLRHLLLMGLLAGGPTVLGTWIGGFTYSAVWSVLFLALGAGAIFQVVYELIKLMVRDAREAAGTVANFVGLIVGLGIMYLTGLLVQL
ncbi:MAG: metal transporter [candidate division NC10 bacterium]|nr:metal transporter [candidate division NC10 bacterium]